MRRPWPTRGCYAIEKIKELGQEIKNFTAYEI
jgi:hypothetical protein